ncbi:motility associated factor glycosyltransferase family protein [Thalassotalea ganghwensis]
MTLEQMPPNFQVIEQRWPQLFDKLVNIDTSSNDVEVLEQTLVVNGIQVTSNYDRLGEAKRQVSRIPVGANEAYVYGPALGDAISLLLERKGLLKLYVVILSKVTFIHALSAIETMDWLSDSRVHLIEAESLSDVGQPFCANPAELRLVDTNNETIADWVQLELNHDFIVNQHQGHRKEQLAHIDNNRSFILDDGDIKDIAPPTTDRIYIAAAGPTLNHHLEYLKTHKPFIIAVDASVRVLVAENIIPDIVVSIDYTAFQFFKDIPSHQLAKTKLVYFPNVEHEVLSYWPGKRYCSYSNTPMYKDIAHYAPKTSLFCAGSVVHPAIDLAVYLQAKTIILLGTDFAFSFNKSHASTENSAPASHELSIENAQDSVINGFGERVATMTSLKGYLRELERYISKHPTISFINGSQHSAVIKGATLWNR